MMEGWLDNRVSDDHVVDSLTGTAAAGTRVPVGYRGNKLPG